MRGLLFRPELGLAIATGRKVQTRRRVWADDCGVERHELDLPDCPYGFSGARLYVKEPWAVYGMSVSVVRSFATVSYRGGGDVLERDLGDGKDSHDQCRRAMTRQAKQAKGSWLSSLLMPEWAARSIIELTDVRVERVQDITEDDALAAGCAPRMDTRGMVTADYCGEHDAGPRSAREQFRGLWGYINGAKSWDESVWVWVLSFKRVTP